MTTRHLDAATSIGTLRLVAGGGALTGVYFPGHRVQPERGEAGEAVDRDELLQAAATQLREYLAGERTGFDLPLATGSRSELEERVWRQLRQIPYGRTTSYGRLATQLGDPHLAQAVGGAVGRNPLGIVVPCHRVVGADGGYTGFAGGERLKAWLLGMEAHTSGASLLPPEPYRP